MQSLQQVVPDARRFKVPHVRSFRILAIQVSHLLKRLLQTHESKESPIFAHW